GFRPNLESLEQRDVPSSLTLTAQYSQGTSWFLTGHLTDRSASNAYRLINFGGQASGSVLTSNNGDYSLTESIANLGDLTAQTADGTSNIPTFPLTDPAAALTNFTAREGPYHCFTFTLDASGGGRNLSGWTVAFISGPISLRGYTDTLDSNGHC